MYGLLLVSFLLKLSQCTTVVTKTELVVVPYYVTVISEANGVLATLPQCQAPATYSAPASAGSAAPVADYAVPAADKAVASSTDSPVLAATSASGSATSASGSSDLAAGSSPRSKPAVVVASDSQSSSSAQATSASHAAAPTNISPGAYYNTTYYNSTLNYLSTTVHSSTYSNVTSLSTSIHSNATGLSTSIHSNATSLSTSIYSNATQPTSLSTSIHSNTTQFTSLSSSVTAKSASVNSTSSAAATTTSKPASIKTTSTISSKVTTSKASSTLSSLSSISSKTTTATPTPTTTGVGSGVIPSAVLGYSYKDDKPVDPKQEGKAILDTYWSKLWTGKAFADRYTCGGKTDTPVVWPVAVAFQGYVDGEKAFPGQYTDKLNQIYNMLMNYYNSKKKGCSASMNKDNDLYYDDNAQIASALVTAYEATNDIKYLNRGADIVEFLMTGWNNTTGGVTWHLGAPYVASISTTETALACLRLYEHKKDERYLEFGQKSMDWIREKLWDKGNNLIYDGETGNSVNKNMEFSYQVGTAISAYIKLYQQIKDEKYKQYAHDLAKSGINRNLVIYNRDVANKLRFWRDELDFTQLLFEGLADYYELIEQDNDVRNEIAREARYVYDFAKNFPSGLYFNTVNPWGNGDQNYAIWKATGATQKSAVNAAGFCDRNTTGTYKSKLITGGAAARVFFLTARSVSKI